MPPASISALRRNMQQKKRHSTKHANSENPTKAQKEKLVQKETRKRTQNEDETSSESKQ